MTLYDLITSWRSIKIVSHSTHLRCPEAFDDAMQTLKAKRTYDSSVVFVMFEGSNGPLNGRGFVFAIDSNNQIIGQELVWIS